MCSSRKDYTTFYNVCDMVKEVKGWISFLPDDQRTVICTSKNVNTSCSCLLLVSEFGTNKSVFKNRTKVFQSKKG